MTKIHKIAETAETTANKGDPSTLQNITKQLCGEIFSGNTKVKDENGNILQKEEQVTRNTSV